ncbi:alpha/beta fold hydrolase [Pelagibius marinus]|uniref:alpha/beta fold hydrolase n=1 Tax=Pelagibius marinus TaxID=2762760 RepID=UPI001872E8A4|nr:alpha/beta hydrolase [Pelagibius marinus]
MGAVREDSLRCLSRSGFHELAYRESGPDHPVPVLCLHGLARNARDFDTLAADLAAAGRRVVCADVVGRGDSGWLRDPLDYGYPQYLADTAALIARLGSRQVDIVGTSMGGLIGMMLAAQPDNPIRRLVVNDVGPFIPKAALARILDYFGEDPRFAGLAEAEAYHRRIYRSFGDLSDAQWRHLTETSLRRDGDQWRLHYDPRIAEPMRAVEMADVDLWPLWDAVSCPVLVLRGAESDLLLPQTAAEMKERGPRAELIEFPGCGHAPALLDPAQIAPLRDWLAGE